MSSNEQINSPILKLVTTPQVLPFHPTPPVVCGVMNDQLFVISRDEVRKIVVVVAVDKTGNSSELGSLPIDFVEGMAQCNDALYLLGGQDQTFRRLQLKPDGSVWHDVPLPTGRDLLLAPRLACGYGTRYGLWIDGRGQLHIAQDKTMSVVILTDITLNLIPLVTPAGLTLLRSAGIPDYLEFMRWEDGSIQQTQTIEKSEQGHSPLLFLQDNDYLLIWIDRPTQTIQIQRFDASFIPHGPAQTLLSVPPPGGFRWLRGMRSTNNKILLMWQIEWPGMEFSDFGEPLPQLEQYIALLDPIKQQLGALTAINYPSESYFSGRWVEDRFIFVLGGGQATILAYKPM